MKKTLCFVLGLMFAVTGMFSVAMAQNPLGPDEDFVLDPITNVSQKGSLIVFPKIQVSGDNTSPLVDTLIEIGNNYTDWFFSTVRLQCFYVYSDDPVGTTRQTQKFQIPVFPGQKVWWSARTGAGNVKVPSLRGEFAELKCWAVDTTGQFEVTWNHLFGEATLFYHDLGDAGTYSSWNFQRWQDAPMDPDQTTPGILNLDQVEYDACPDFLVTDIVSQNGAVSLGARNTIRATANEIALVNCTQNFEQVHKIHTTKAFFDIYLPKLGHYFDTADQCVTDFAQTNLTDITIGGFLFTRTELRAPFAMVVIDTDAVGRCRTTTNPDGTIRSLDEELPLLGVSVRFLENRKTGDSMVTAYTPNHSNREQFGEIFWYAGDTLAQ